MTPWLTRTLLSGGEILPVKVNTAVLVDPILASLPWPATVPASGGPALSSGRSIVPVTASGRDGCSLEAQAEVNNATKRIARRTASHATSPGRDHQALFASKDKLVA